MVRGAIGLSAFLLALLVRGPLGEANAARRIGTFRYTPNPQLAKLLSLGHRSTFANLLWLQALPDLSRPFLAAEDKERWLEAVLPLIARLEPSFVTVYSYGAAYLAMVGHDAAKAVELLEKGVERNPANVELRVQLAMAHFMHFDDRERTVAILKEVVEGPDCDAFTLAFYTSLLVDTHADMAAVAQWLPFLEHGNDEIRGEAELQLQRTYRSIALRAWREFQERTGRRPRELAELRDGELMAPAVMDAVLGSCELLPDGKLRFPELTGFEFERRLRGAEHWARIFRSEQGRWPSLDELQSSEVAGLPPAPAGQRYEFAAGQLTLQPQE